MKKIQCNNCEYFNLYGSFFGRCIIKNKDVETMKQRQCRHYPKQMTVREAVEILENHNKWRRGDNTIPQPTAKILGEAIDKIINHLKK
jgi:hypothetical protein